MSKGHIMVAGLLLTLLAGGSHAGEESEQVTLRDPMRPDGYRSARQPAEQKEAEKRWQWRVNSILISEDRRLAVVNGRSVRVGDRVGPASVVEILPYAVRLRHGGKLKTILLEAGSVKQPSGRQGQ